MTGKIKQIHSMDNSIDNGQMAVDKGQLTNNG